MKWKFIIALVVLGSLLPSLAVFAQQQQQRKDDEAIKSVIRKLWASTTMADYPRLLATPYLSVSVTNHGSKLLSFQDAAELHNSVQFARQEESRLADVPPTMGGPMPEPAPKPQFSNFVITRPAADMAYVSYGVVVDPTPKKQPALPLVAVLRKENNAWKLVFTALP